MNNFNIQDLLSAQTAIIKLENGESITSNSDEHKALSWAVVRLTNELLFEPLTVKGLENAEEFAKEYKDNPPTISEKE